MSGQTMWWGWSTFLPAGFNIDSDAVSPVGNGWLIFTQHGSSDTSGPNIAFGLTKGTRTPHLIMSAAGAGGSSEWVSPNPIPLGVWNDFVVGIVWGESATTGRLTVKMNGQTLINNAPCANLYAGQSAYFKQGIYRSESMQTQTPYHTGTSRGLTEASVTLPPQ